MIKKNTHERQKRRPIILEGISQELERTYALITGKAIVSTPFLHAKEVISEGCAMECKFRDPESMDHCIRTLLTNEDMKTDFEEKAYRYNQNMIWPTSQWST